MTPVFKKGKKNNIKIIAAQSVFCQMYQKHLKDVSLDKYQTIWTFSHQKISANSEKIINRTLSFVHA